MLNTASSGCWTSVILYSCSHFQQMSSTRFFLLLKHQFSSIWLKSWSRVDLPCNIQFFSWPPFVTTILLACYWILVFFSAFVIYGVWRFFFHLNSAQLLIIVWTQQVKQKTKKKKNRVSKAAVENHWHFLIPNIKLLECNALYIWISHRLIYIAFF